MNRIHEVFEIYHKNVDNAEKIRLLEDLALDLFNEMEAQDQNMRPEVQNRYSEALRLTKNFIRQLQSTDNKAA